MNQLHILGDIKKYKVESFKTIFNEIIETMMTNKKK